MKNFVLFLAILIFSFVAFAARSNVLIVLVPDADIDTDSWSSDLGTFYEAVSDPTSNPDGKVITSPAGPGSNDKVNLSLTETVQGQATRVIISVVASTTNDFLPHSLNVSWYDSKGDLIASMDTGSLTTTLTQYNSGSLTISVNRTDINSSFLSLTGSGLIASIVVDAVNLNITTQNTSIRANATTLGVVTNLTGENFTMRGNCEAIGLSSATNVTMVLQNSTDNVTFTNIKTDSTGPIYANVSSYYFGTLTNENSSSPTFNINVTKPGTYSLRLGCNGTNTDPRQDNSSSNNVTILQYWGYLNVALDRPFPEIPTNVAQGFSFTTIANITCSSITNNPTTKCGKVNGTAQYNESCDFFQGCETLSPVNTTVDEHPFWTSDGNPQSCAELNFSDRCSLSWGIVPTAAIGRQHRINVRFDSENASFINSNTTQDSNVTITTCIVDFFVWDYLDFGTVSPNTRENAAVRNSQGYTVSLGAASCTTDFFIKGSNLTNVTYPVSNFIGVGNITWSNISNTYSTSVNLSDIDVQAAEDEICGFGCDFSLWFWINTPPVYAGKYNGTISITGVESV